MSRRAAEGAGRRPHTSQNPATGNWLASYTLADDTAIDRLLTLTQRAAIGWRTTSFNRRSSLLERVAANLRLGKDQLAGLITTEMGKPITEAHAEIEKCALACEFYAAHGEAMLAPLHINGDGHKSVVAYRPLGAILAVMPWNFPFWQVFRFALPTLMAGNVALLKHAPNTSGCALAIEALFVEAGLPEGGFTTLLIDETQVGGIIADDRVAAVTLTGSERAGAAVAALAGAAIKKTVLELGGSDAYIVCKDADLEAAVTTAVRSRFQNAGQSCIAAKRFLVEAAVYAEFLERFTDRVKQLVIGDPREEQVEIGPLARRDLRENLARQVKASVADGARVLCGGQSLSGTGYYYSPTVLSDVKQRMPVMQEEVFGPVAPVMMIKDIEAAITITNSSHYGLGASLWTKDLERARRIAARLEVGSVFINSMVRSDPRLPFGGVKRSGYGRELGAFGMLEFMNIQSICS